MVEFSFYTQKPLIGKFNIFETKMALLLSLANIYINKHGFPDHISGITKMYFNICLQCYTLHYCFIFVCFIFRGGGELGRKWYHMGRRTNKNKTFEVFRTLLKCLCNHMWKLDTHWKWWGKPPHDKQEKQTLAGKRENHILNCAFFHCWERSWLYHLENFAANRSAYQELFRRILFLSISFLAWAHTYKSYYTVCKQVNSFLAHKIRLVSRL